VRSVTCSISIEHTEQQSNRATEHSAGHVTQRSAVLAAGRNERRRYLTFCLRPYHRAPRLDRGEIERFPYTFLSAISLYRILRVLLLDRSG
jgi:hypothetical protein